MHVIEEEKQLAPKFLRATYEIALNKGADVGTLIDILTLHVLNPRR